MISLLKDYLVVLGGSPRGGEETWNSLYKYVINHLDADLAICCSDKWNQNISLFERAKYKWVFPEMDDYFEYYEKFFNGTWKEYFNTGKDTGLLSSGSVHFVFKDIVLKKYLSILKQYKYIIYSRFDQKYSNFHPHGEEEKILIPEGEDYFGVCDRHAMFPSKFSEQFLGICEFIDDSRNLDFSQEFNNCETTFKKHLEASGLIHKLSRYKRSQFTTSLKGEHTNWRVAKYKLYFHKNLMIKYPDEFLDSISNLIFERGFRYLIFNEYRLLINYLYLNLRKMLGDYKRKLWIKRK